MWIGMKTYDAVYLEETYYLLFHWFLNFSYALVIKECFKLYPRNKLF